MQFQFTPLREGRPEPSPMIGGIDLFQFTPLREGRHSARGVTFSTLWFQFTPLREGRPVFDGDRFICGCFNSRPCARGDSKAYQDELATLVSIHAPARGATLLESHNL